jgi:hypothetical protein
MLQIPIQGVKRTDPDHQTILSLPNSCLRAATAFASLTELASWLQDHRRALRFQRGSNLQSVCLGGRQGSAEIRRTTARKLLVQRLLNGPYVAAKKMAVVSHSDTASLNRPSADVAQAAVRTRYRFWVRDSTVSCWRQLPGSHTMAEMARMLRQKRFAEFALIDGSARPA